MKKQYKWTVFALALLVIGAGLVCYLTHRVRLIEKTQPFSNTQKKVSFEDFIKNNNESYKCITNLPAGPSNKEINITYYIAGKIIRGEYANPYKEENVTFIISSGYYHVWTSGSDTGSTIEMINDQNGNLSGEVYYSYIKSTGDYNCVPWIANMSLFSLPMDIQFKEVVQ